MLQDDSSSKKDYEKKPRLRVGHAKDNAMAQTFRELRQAAGFTQVELAKKADVGLAQIRKLEQGNHNVSFNTIRVVCTTLGAQIIIQKPTSHK